MTKLTDALGFFDNLIEASLGGHLGAVVDAARKWAALTESGPIPASKCVFPLVEEELLVYPTDQRRSYGQGNDIL